MASSNPKDSIFLQFMQTLNNITSVVSEEYKKKDKESKPTPPKVKILQINVQNQQAGNRDQSQTIPKNQKFDDTRKYNPKQMPNQNPSNQRNKGSQQTGPGSQQTGPGSQQSDQRQSDFRQYGHQDSDQRQSHFQHGNHRDFNKRQSNFQQNDRQNSDRRQPNFQQNDRRDSHQRQPNFRQDHQNFNRRQTNFHQDNHGDSDQRQANFQQGNRIPPVCRPPTVRTYTRENFSKDVKPKSFQFNNPTSQFASNNTKNFPAQEMPQSQALHFNRNFPNQERSRINPGPNLQHQQKQKFNYQVHDMHSGREAKFGGSNTELNVHGEFKFNQSRDQRDSKFQDQNIKLNAQHKTRFRNSNTDLRSQQESKFDDYISELHARREGKLDEQGGKFPVNEKNFALNKNINKNKLIENKGKGEQFWKKNETSNSQSEIKPESNISPIQQNPPQTKKQKKLKARNKLKSQNKSVTDLTKELEKQNVDGKIPISANNNALQTNFVNNSDGTKCIVKPNTIKTTLNNEEIDKQSTQIVITTVQGSADMMEKFVQFKLPNFEFVFKSIPENSAVETKVSLEFDSLSKAKKALKVLQKLNDNAFKVELMKNKAQNILENLDNSFSEQLILAEKLLNQHITKQTILNSEIEKGQLQNEMKEIDFAAFTTKQLPLMNQKIELENQKQEFLLFLDEMRNKIKILPKDSLISIKNLKKKYDHEFEKFKNPLPIYTKRQKILEAMKKSQVCILAGDISSGKSIELVQYIYNKEICNNGIIACSQPCGISVMYFAEQVSKDFGQMVGQLVGYKVEMQSKMNKNTKIIFMRDEVMLDECQRDPEFKMYSCIIIDQVTEHNISTDLLLGSLKHCLMKRKDLKVVILADKSDVKSLEQYFQSGHVVDISERTIPMEIQYEEQNNLKDSSIVKVINCISKIHKNSPINENIFVFLSTISEVEEVCFKLKTALPSSDKQPYMALRLYDQLPTNELKSLFREMKCRKIILALKCAELLQLIPNVCHVIDTCMEKEIIYDVTSNTSIVQIKPASKISVDHRTIKNGCVNIKNGYLLCTKEQYNMLKNNIEPEILKLDPAKVILKMKWQTKDVLPSHLLNPINEQDLNLAVKRLQEMGAISQTGESTVLGLQIAQLSLDPLLSKMILMSIDKGKGLEAIVLAAIITLSGNERLSWDFKQNDSFQSSTLGDPFTLLYMYKEWKMSKNMKDMINNRFFAIIDQAVMKIIFDISNHLQFAVHLNWDEGNEYQTIIGQIFLYCYCHSLCRYSGIKKHGYIHCLTGNKVHLFHTSMLECLNQRIHYVIYDKLFKNKHSYIMNAIAVPMDWVGENITNIKSNLDKIITSKDIDKNQVLTINGISKYILKEIFIGKDSLKLQELEENITSKCNSESKVTVNVNLENRSVEIIIPTKHHAMVQAIFDDFLHTERESLKMLDEEYFYPNETSLHRIIISYGAVITKVLQPWECREILVIGISEKLNTMKVVKFMQQFGKLQGFDEENEDDKQKIKIRFKNPEDAVESLDSPDCNKLFNWTLNSQMLVEPTCPPTTFIIVVSWLRRDLFAMIKFKMEDFSKIIANYVPEVKILGKSIKSLINPAFLDTITLVNLPSELSIACIKRSFYPEPVEVTFSSTEPFQTSENDKQNIIKEMKRLLINYQEESYEIVLNESTNQDNRYELVIKFEDKEEGVISALTMIEKDHVLYGKKLFVKPQFIDILVCPITLYEFKKHFKEEMAKFTEVKNGNFSVKFEERTPKTGEKNIIIHILTENMMDILRLRYIFLQEIRGDIMECHNLKQNRYLLSKEGLAYLKKIEGTLDIYFNINLPKKLISIHGPLNLRIQAKAMINNFLQEIFHCGIISREIPIRGAGEPEGFLKDLLKRFGSHLEDLSNIPGIIDLKLNHNCCSLEIIGSELSVTRIETMLTNLMKELILTVERNVSMSTQEISCILCSSSISENMYEMAICGHQYCIECIQFYIYMKQLPLKCLQYSCPMEFSIIDLKQLLSESQLKDLTEAAIMKYVDDNPNKLGFCPTMNCNALYFVTKEENVYECNQCSAKICTSCKDYYHSEITCSIYQLNNKIVQKEAERIDGFKKFCSICKYRLEKNVIHESVICKSCKTPSCWYCGTVFMTEDDTEIHTYTCKSLLNERFGTNRV